MADDKKPGAAIVDKPSSIKLPGQQKPTLDPRKARQQEDQEYVIHQTAQAAGERLRKLALNIKASPELRKEIEELAKDIEESVPRIAQKTRSPESLTDQIARAVDSAERYITAQAKKETEKEKKEEKRKEEKEHQIHPHGLEKPKKADKTEAEKIKDRLDELRAEIRGEKQPEAQATTTNPTEQAPGSAASIQQLMEEEASYLDKAEVAKEAVKKESLTHEQKTAIRLEELRSEMQEKNIRNPAKPPLTTAQKEHSGANKILDATQIQDLLRQGQIERRMDQIRSTVPSASASRVPSKMSSAAPAQRKQMPTQRPGMAVPNRPAPVRGVQIRVRAKPPRSAPTPGTRTPGSRKMGSMIGGVPSITETDVEISQVTPDTDVTQTFYRRWTPGVTTDEQTTEESEAPETSDRRSYGNPRADNDSSVSGPQRGGLGVGGNTDRHIQRGGLGGSYGKGRKKDALDDIESFAKKRASMSLLSLLFSPTFWIVAGVIFLIIFIIFIIIGGDGEEQKGGPQENPLKINKTGPSQAQLGQDLIYQITVTYPGSAEDIIVSDRLPDGTDYVSSVPAGAFDAATRTVTWSAKTLALPLTGPINMPISLTLRSTKDNLTIINQATVNLVGGQTGAGPGGYMPPSDDNCGGKYKFTSSLGKNFGDPGCNFNKDLLYTQLKQEDPANADVWFNKVIPCESGYNPNAYAGPQTGTPDARGAWGLFQMGSSSPPGSPPPAPGKNGPNDRGDVPWNIQATNAATYGKKISSLGAYWACAR